MLFEARKDTRNHRPLRQEVIHVFKPLVYLSNPVFFAIRGFPHGTLANQKSGLKWLECLAPILLPRLECDGQSHLHPMLAPGKLRMLHSKMGDQDGGLAPGTKIGDRDRVRIGRVGPGIKIEGPDGGSKTGDQDSRLGLRAKTDWDCSPNGHQ